MPTADTRWLLEAVTSMSKSVIRKNQFSGVNSSHTPREDQRIQLDGQIDGFSVKMKATAQPSAPVIDSHPAFSVWWERWRREARTRVSPSPGSKTDHAPNTRLARGGL
jgi:hypothetical protein